MARSILIIYPHWPPSNLVGVHRVRLMVNEMSSLGWSPIVLTVDPLDYEEPHALGSESLVAKEVEVHHVRARPVVRILGQRIIGDIGLRAWHSLKNMAHQLCESRDIEAIWFSIPSWYPCLMGPSLHKRHGIPYAVDYQDPWIHDVDSTLPWWHRARWTMRMAKGLEPKALRQVAFITAINEAYMEGPLERHPQLKLLPNVTMQVGFSERDHSIPLPELDSPWSSTDQVLLYAGAYWEQGAPLFEEIIIAWKALKTQNDLPENARLVFIGTGHPYLKSLSDIATQHGTQDSVIEIPDRIPFLEVQELLRRASATLVVGSTAKHYSASKIFQLLLSGKPIVAYLHPESEARSILMDCNADLGFASFDDRPIEERTSELKLAILRAMTNPPWSPDLSTLKPFTSRSAAKKLLASFESCSTP